MLMGDVLLVYCFKYLHSRHNAEYTVIVTAVFYRVAVRSHYDTLCIGVCAGERCVDISNIIYLDLCADSLHTLDELVTGHNSLGRERVTCDTAVACITEFAESGDLILHSV